MKGAPGPRGSYFTLRRVKIKSPLRQKPRLLTPQLAAINTVEMVPQVSASGLTRCGSYSPAPSSEDNAGNTRKEEGKLAKVSTGTF